MSETSKSRRAIDVTAKRKQLLWDGRIPVGELTVIAGPPSMGKSTLGYRIAADVGVPTLFITWEEDFETVFRPRLEASGVDLSLAWHHAEIVFARTQKSFVKGINRVPTNHRVETLRDLIKRYGAKLVIVDPITRHVYGASIHNDQQFASMMAPYLEMAKELRVAFVAEVHVLRDLSPKAHPLTAVPAGLANVSKAVYLFGDHPDFGADPNLRVLANTGKFNFGKQPSSLEFEFEIRTVPVLDEESGQAVMEEFGCWVQRGESRVTAKQLLVTLAPETKERKSDRVAHFLLDFLNGRDWVPLLEIKNAVLDLDPPVSWRTVQRLVENEMVGQIEVKRDDTDARKLWWRLSDETQGAFEELTEPDDEIVTEEVDVPEVPDTVPEEWGDEKDDGTDG